MTSSGVERLPDLLQDHVALHLDLARIEDRVQQDVGHHVERERHVRLQHAGVIGGHLARGVGVDIAAHILDLLGDLQGAARLVPLKAMCSRKCAMPFCSAVRGATGHHPDAERRGGRPGIASVTTRNPLEQWSVRRSPAPLLLDQGFEGGEVVGDPVTRSGRS
jgi:hypothetical protein